MAKYYFSSLSFSFLLLLHGCVHAQFPEPGKKHEPRRSQNLNPCRVGRLEAHEPIRKVHAEAGVTEYWDEKNEQFQCAGAAAYRQTIKPKGLLLPSFANAPKLTYIVQGKGIYGAVIPGCPETYQSFQKSPKEAQRREDRHQKIWKFHKGDVIAVLAGVTHWIYNRGDEPLVMVTLHDTSNSDNQLDATPRKFNLAGKPGRQGEDEDFSNNIFRGFDAETLAEAFGISTEMARKLQGENDKRGDIVLVKNGLQLISPSRMEDEEEEGRIIENSSEETYCSISLRQNIGDPEVADIYNPHAGRISSLKNEKFPILNYLQLSVESGVLYKNSLVVPYWNMNAHSVIYVIRGSARVQISGNYRRPVYDGELREGQMLIAPQNFVVLKKAGEDGFRWVAFKTDDNAMISPLAGETSTFRGIPVDVLINAYQISNKEAMELKYNKKFKIYPGSWSEV